MLTSSRVLKLVRQAHLYTGIFIAPAILFFAFTGSLQTFSLHETTEGSPYKPAHWIMTLAQIHKNQTSILPAKKPKAAAPTSKLDPLQDFNQASSSTTKTSKVPGATPVPEQKPMGHLPLKFFFLLVALGLVCSTLTGIYMAYKYSRSKVLVSALLLAGCVIPLLLLRF
jgi:hypothetical protein